MTAASDGKGMMVDEIKQTTNNPKSPQSKNIAQIYVQKKWGSTAADPHFLFRRKIIS